METKNSFVKRFPGIVSSMGFLLMPVIQVIAVPQIQKPNFILILTFCGYFYDEKYKQIWHPQE